MILRHPGSWRRSLRTDDSTSGGLRRRRSLTVLGCQYQRARRARIVEYCRREPRQRRRRALAVGLSPRTVRRWEHAGRLHPRELPRPRGRRIRRASLRRRNELYRFLILTGPQIGVAPLHRLFPDMSRLELGDFLRRFRRVWSRRHPQIIARLKWNRPGTVWAVDHVEVRRPAEGRSSFILNVRDLASHYQLAWQPVPDASAEITCRILESLFKKHGRPLVLKSDNGSGFIGEKTGRLLETSGILHLRSPPRRPAYNGSCEAGGGSLKKLTSHQALLAGRAGSWTSEDAERARRLHNTIHRPRGRGGPTASEAWRLRRPPDEHERAALGATVARLEDDLAQTRELNQNCGDERRPAWLTRTAISLVLQQLGYLNITRRLITPPIKSRKTANIR